MPVSLLFSPAQKFGTCRSFFFLPRRSNTQLKTGWSIGNSANSRSGNTRFISSAKFCHCRSPQKSSAIKKPPFRRYRRVFCDGACAAGAAPAKALRQQSTGATQRQKNNDRTSSRDQPPAICHVRSTEAIRRLSRQHAQLIEPCARAAGRHGGFVRLF